MAQENLFCQLYRDRTKTPDARGRRNGWNSCQENGGEILIKRKQMSEEERGKKWQSKIDEDSENL